MWKKMLKLKDVAKTFHMKVVGNGRHSSFWFDRWSDLGSLSELLGDRGPIDLGIRKEATVEEDILKPRRRRHRLDRLNDIERALNSIAAEQSSTGDDLDMWRGNKGFKPLFSTQETWLMLRETKAQCGWAKVVWFSQATPKFSFMAWLAMLDRMSTMDRVSRWSQGIDTTCVLCTTAAETRDHLFSECTFSSQIWQFLMEGVGEKYSGTTLL